MWVGGRVRGTHQGVGRGAAAAVRVFQPLPPKNPTKKTQKKAADEVKQMVTYKRDYFNSPWNYMDVMSCTLLAAIFVLHITRASHQVFVSLMALQVLLLSLRMLYFCMAYEVSLWFGVVWVWGSVRDCQRRRRCGTHCFPTNTHKTKQTKHFGALLRMVLIVIKDMRFFFVLLVFLLCSFGAFGV